MHILVIQWMNWWISLESRQVAHVFKFRSSVAAQWESPAAEVASASTSWTSTVLDIGCRMTTVIYCLIGTGTVFIAKKYGTFLVYLEIQQGRIRSLKANHSWIHSWFSPAVVVLPGRSKVDYVADGLQMAHEIRVELGCEPLPQLLTT